MYRSNWKEMGYKTIETIQRRDFQRRDDLVDITFKKENEKILIRDEEGRHGIFSQKELMAQYYKFIIRSWKLMELYDIVNIIYWIWVVWLNMYV